MYAVECTVTEPFSTGYRLKWLLLGSPAMSFQGRYCSRLCCRLVAAESFLGAFLLGREQGASCSLTLCLTDHPYSCCVVYILLLRQVCICVLKNHFFLTVISVVPWLLHWNHKILLTTLENLTWLEVWLFWRLHAHLYIHIYIMWPV